MPSPHGTQTRQGKTVSPSYLQNPALVPNGSTPGMTLYVEVNDISSVRSQLWFSFDRLTRTEPTGTELYIVVEIPSFRDFVFVGLCQPVVAGFFFFVI